MITSKLLLCAEGVIRDAETNSISIFNILDQVQAEGFPLLIPRIVVFCTLERETDDDQEITIRLEVKLDAINILDAPVPINFQDKQRNNAIITLGGIPIPAPGMLNVVLKLGDTELGTYQVFVTLRETTIQVQQG